MIIKQLTGDFVVNYFEMETPPSNNSVKQLLYQILTQEDWLYLSTEIFAVLPPG